jgi:serine/threonine-protein kinase
VTALRDWPRVKRVLEGALLREGEEAAAYVAEACGSDRALRAEVERLLAAREPAGRFLESPAARLLGERLAGDDDLSGRDLNSYRLVSRLGAGGMGEVYLARDTRLGRDVAIKVLPPALAADPDRIARFEHEAKMLASLNHPHIGSIYGFEEADGRHALVLELVEGPTLADRIAKGPLPLDEALAIARQIAEAVEAAHEHGVVHRDLKPANIKLRPDGTVKVLDFGLAKALERGRLDVPSAASAPTSPVATSDGRIVGTPFYMSPEQARGRPVDRRTDVWAFGCVLYEMLTGRRPFEGKDAAEVLAQVLEREPDLASLPASTPSSVRRLLRRCLEKDRKKRLPDLGVARLEIDDASLPSVRDAPPTPARRAPLVAAVLVAGALVGAFVQGRLSPTTPRPLVRASLTLAEPLDFGFQQPALAVSPDGARIVYRASGGGPLRSRFLDHPSSSPIAGTEEAVNPFFSPDGRWLGFFVGRALKKVAFAGGAVVTVATLPSNVGAQGYRGASWGDDGTIAFASSTGGGLFGVSERGGEPKALTTVDPAAGEMAHRWPHLLPGGRAILFTVKATHLQSFDDAPILARSLDTGAQHAVAQGGSAQFVPTGHLVYARAGSLFAVRFDPERLAVTGAPVKVADGVVTHPESGAAQVAISRTGTLVHAAGGFRSAERPLLWIDRRGAARPVTERQAPFWWPRVSPDGRRIAVTMDGAFSRIWVLDVERGTLARASPLGGDHDRGTWTPDGLHLTFGADTAGTGAVRVFSDRVDGTGQATLLLDGPEHPSPMSWSPDGRFLLCRDIRAETGQDVWVYSAASRALTPFLQGASNEQSAVFSPDGLFVAYVSDESGRPEVYVRPFPGPGTRSQVSLEGGTAPVWSRDGRELFFAKGDTLFVAAVRLGGTFSSGAARPLFSGPYGFDALTANYDVAPDGRRFVVPGARVDPPPRKLELVLDWFQELRRLAP